MWNNNLLLASDGSVALGGLLRFPDGTTQTSAFNPNTPINLTANSGTSQTSIASFTNGTNQAYTSITGAGSASIVPTWSNGSQILEFVPYGSGNGIVSSFTGSLLFQTNERTNQMAILPNGDVGIRTTSPCSSLTAIAMTNCKLSVAGGITAQEIVVNTTGADYVFQPAYRLAPLTEVADYIEANHHLPGIPAAVDMSQNGVSVGDLQTKLLAKIEELTLHMIEAQKENKQLRERLAKVEGKLDAATPGSPR